MWRDADEPSERAAHSCSGEQRATSSRESTPLLLDCTLVDADEQRPKSSRDRASRRYAGVPDLVELAGGAGWASVSSTSTLEVGCFPFAGCPTSGPRDDVARAVVKRMRQIRAAMVGLCTQPKDSIGASGCNESGGGDIRRRGAYLLRMWRRRVSDLSGVGLYHRIWCDRADSSASEP